MCSEHFLLIHNLNLIFRQDDGTLDLDRKKKTESRSQKAIDPIMSKVAKN